MKDQFFVKEKNSLPCHREYGQLWFIGCGRNSDGGINLAIHLAALLAGSQFLIPSSVNLSLNPSMLFFTNDEKFGVWFSEEDFIYEKLRNSSGPKEHPNHECTRCMPNRGCHIYIIRLFSWTHASCKVIVERKSTTISSAIGCKTGTSRITFHVFNILISFTFKLENAQTIIIEPTIFWFWTGWFELIYWKHQSCTSSNPCFNILPSLERTNSLWRYYYSFEECNFCALFLN